MSKCEATDCTREAGSSTYCSVECSIYGTAQLKAEVESCREEVERLRDELQGERMELDAKKILLKKMLKALDIYWKMVPEYFDANENCPYCGQPNQDDWYHETCLEDSWLVFDNLRKQVEAQGENNE